MRYIISKKATEDLDGIWRYTYSQWSERQADEYYNLLIEKKKEFDAVKFMRQQRDRLSEMLLGMTKQEIVEYFRKKAIETTVKPY